MSAHRPDDLALRARAVSLLSIAFLVLSACTNSTRAKAEHIAHGDQLLQQRKFMEASLEYRNALQIDDKSAPAHWGLARAYEGMQRFSESFEEIRRTVELDADNLDARVKAGNYFLLTQPPQTDEAARMAREVLQKSPNHIEATILDGNVLFVQGHADLALARLNHAVELDPQRVESYISLAKFYVSSKSNNKAEEAFQHAIQVNGSLAIAHTEYARFLVSNDRNDQAQQELEKAVNVDPSNRESLFILASFYLVHRKLDKAEPAYQRLAEMDKDKPEGKSVLADYYASVGRTAEAIQIYREVAARTPDYTRAGYRLGELMLQGGDVAGAMAQAEQELRKNAKDMDALMLRAHVRMQSGQQSDAKLAIADLNNVLRQEPSSQQGLYYMADANFTAGQIAQARTYLGDLERFHPSYLAARLMRSQIDLSAGDSKAAIQASTELLSAISKTTPDAENSPQLLNELQTRALATRASAYLSLGDLASARADFQTARDVAPNSVTSYINLASLAIREKKVDEAATLYEQALSINKTDFNALNGLIENVFAPDAKFDQAQQRVDAAFAGGQDSAALHFLKGNIYAHQGNALSAESELRHSLTVDAGYVPAYSSLGALYARMKQPDRAIATYRELLKHDESPATYTLIAILEEGRGNVDGATQAYRKALELDPNSSIAANNLAWMFATHGNGNLDEAVALAQSAVQQSPNMPGYMDTLGCVYQKKGLYGAAAEQFQNALLRDNGNATYRLHLGIAYAGKGDKASAKREIQQALRRAESISQSDADEGRKTLASLEG